MNLLTTKGELFMIKWELFTGYTGYTGIMGIITWQSGKKHVCRVTPAIAYQVTCRRVYLNDAT